MSRTGPQRIMKNHENLASQVETRRTIYQAETRRNEKKAGEEDEGGGDEREEEEEVEEEEDSAIFYNH